MAAYESIGGKSGTIPEMKSEKQFPSSGFYPTKVFLDLATGAGAAAFARFQAPFDERMMETGWDELMRWKRVGVAYVPQYSDDGRRLWATAYETAYPPSVRTAVLNHVRYASMQASNLVLNDVYRNILFKGRQHCIEEHGCEKYLAINFAAGGAAGLTTLCFVYPLDSARAQLGVNAEKAGYEKGLSVEMTKIVKSTGLRGLYRGFAATAPHIFVHYAFMFGVFHTLYGAAKKDHTCSARDLFVVSFCALNAMWGAAFSDYFSKGKDLKWRQPNLKNMYFVGSLSRSLRNPVMPLLVIYHMAQMHYGYE